MKNLIITEKPSVARQFAAALHVEGNHDGYIENAEWVITWAVGHLVTLSYPEVYDERYKKWSLNDLPFLPTDYRYEVIKSSAKQFKVINTLFHRDDISFLYNAGDSGREGEYIQRLIYQETGCDKPVKRVWIDSQTDEEILRGIREAKDSSFYDNLSDAAYMRAIEDYSAGINFSRALSLKYGYAFNQKIKSKKYIPISVGRVMTCVLGMVVEREMAIRSFVPTPYFGLKADTGSFECSWKAVKGSSYFQSPLLYDETGFKAKKDAEHVLKLLTADPRLIVETVNQKTEKKAPPLLFNLAELQSACSKALKISPGETLAIAQKLYEAKLTTYPRTDARVLSTAIAKVIDKNLVGLSKGTYHAEVAKGILDTGAFKGIAKTKYTDDKKITDHYAIIPTGQISGLKDMKDLDIKVYHMIVDRFLSIFLPAAVFKKFEAALIHMTGEYFFANDKILVEKGYLSLYEDEKPKTETPLSEIKERDILPAEFSIKESKTSPPKRYDSGSLILAMENAGKLIEEEDLREQIKGSGIGTSATRAATIDKLVKDSYIRLNKKTQVITPDPIGEEVYHIVKSTLPSMLNPKMTASWEKGLSEIESGNVTKNEFRTKMEDYIRKQVTLIKGMDSAGSVKASDSADPVEKTVIGTCPVCGKKVFLSPKGSWYCEGYKDTPKCFFGAPSDIVSAMTDENKKALLSTGNSGVIHNIKSKDKKSTYDAVFKEDSGKMAWAFVDPETDIKCPKCGKTLIKKKYSYDCPCGFTMSRYVATTLIPEENMKDLLTKGECGPFPITKKDGSTFTAGLKVKEDNKFEFCF